MPIIYNPKTRIAQVIEKKEISMEQERIRGVVTAFFLIRGHFLNAVALSFVNFIDKNTRNMYVIFKLLGE